MKYSAINDLSLLITDAEEQTAASPPSGTDAAAAEGAVSAAADTLQSTVEDAAAVATGASEAAADALRAQIDGAADAAAALGLSGGADAAAIQAQLSGQAEGAVAALRSSLTGVGGEGSPFGEAAASVAALQTQLTGQAEQTLATLRESLAGLGLNVDGIGGDADTAEAAAALQAQLTAGAEDALVAIRAAATDIAPGEVLSAIGSGAGGVQRAVGALLEAFPANGDPVELGGRAIAYLVLAGVPLALAIKAFRALLPVLTLLLRATLALGAAVAIVTIYDAYAALPPAGQTVAQVAVPLTAVLAVGVVSVNKVTRAVDEKTSAVKKSVEESPLGAAKLKVSDALESVRKAAAGLGES